MHDLRMIREQLPALREGMRRRGMLDVLDDILARSENLEKERRLLLQAVEERKAKRNVVSQEVGRKKRRGEPCDALVEESRALGTEIDELDERLALVQATLDGVLLEIPNITLPDVPEGGAEHNRVVRSWGSPRATDGVQPHWVIADRLGVIDFARGAKISRSGFVAYRGAGSRLVRSLIQFMLDLHTREHKYEEAWIPVVVNRASMVGTTQLPKFEEDMFALKDEGLYLIPTAEVAVTNLYREETLEVSDLPIAFTAYSSCFRREAGSAGADTRGILRMHQFDKVELVRYTTPEQSAGELELLTGHAETVLQQLGLPYRVVLLASGDTGFGSCKTYDLEVWAPGVGRWLEVSSCSNFGDFQARRMNLRFRPGKGEKPRFVHTLNGSALALPRVIAAMFEHYQQNDGTVVIPEALRPAFGADRIG
ncbi:MAG TPA: serine--tRNA ligase [Gemmatimonadaceae bacterium]|nr:serine--tRNA ligase [Gemmatimonadaceae bacterium]